MTNTQLDEAVQRLKFAKTFSRTDDGGYIVGALDIETVLAALDEARKASEWQPIETAPKNHTRVLCRYKNNRAFVAYWSISKKAWMDDNDCWRDATNWMPIPPATAIASSSDGQTKEGA